MPNIGAMLKQEIVRLARREIRAQAGPAQKASAQYRRDIAALKRTVAVLARQAAQLQRRSSAATAASSSRPDTRKVRFVAKGLKSHRSRLGLSAGDYGKLVGVSAQSVYNWEQGQATPRAEQLRAIAALRGVGKRAAHSQLQAIDAKGAKSPRKRRR
ncbi:MAG: helix-turn-helix transcriptional regulator [Casimicrobiaceae bacterium]